MIKEFRIAQAACTTGGWARGRKPKKNDLRNAEKRWALRSYQHGPDDEDHQHGQRHAARTLHDDLHRHVTPRMCATRLPDHTTPVKQPSA